MHHANGCNSTAYLSYMRSVRDSDEEKVVNILRGDYNAKLENGYEPANA